MTDDEKRADMRRVLRTIRDDEIRRGSRCPRTMRVADIALAARPDREQRQARRIARAQRDRTPEPPV
jgi:hypothetical protein